MSDDRMDWTVLGRVIGTGTGWDQQDTNVIIIYDFIPAEGIPLPSGDLSFDSELGYFQTYDDEGNEVAVVDAIDTLANVKRKDPL